MVKLIDDMRLDGGVLCLDFVNTIPDRFDNSGRDNLLDINHLLDWALKAGAIGNEKYDALRSHAAAHSEKANKFFREALVLRELLYRVLRPIAVGQEPPAPDLMLFNDILSKYLPMIQLKPADNKFVESCNLPAADLQHITFPIVKSAYDLLLREVQERIKECPNCGWLFLDTTRNGRRKWCSMEDCGSNVKALEYYYRNKGRSQKGT